MDEQMREWFEEQKIADVYNKNTFNVDGIVEPKCYDHKILFVLKEANDTVSDGVIDQIESYRDTAKGKGDGFKNAAIKRRLARMYKVASNRNDLEDAEALKHVAYINLKKTSGAGRTNIADVKEYVCKFKNI
ncbi:hypothetical protein [Ohessyouella blattaphilus]|uniref:Uncharacterized protein n=1 Tax=Ohessyouella blattaphilus TaxID=2949333 RepID=A0ABT1EJ42_9FIRM|nr:hypothetical protein [Ohessyouella blattaphilus]MCP1110541.1 hypothetical protein [Ohessyouella blattaphilus]MCR8563935.1 hypothetical protein [Ohessyouella blattaphilus]MDL2249461.1 hypothetical protein [Lachnospiraceae bacterium OttesenSCG-928-J05]